MRHETAFDVSLAAADLAWEGCRARGRRASPRASSGDLLCPACGSRELEFRLWPSGRAALRCCASCGGRSLVPCRPSAPVCSRRDVERIGEIARRPDGSRRARRKGLRPQANPLQARCSPTSGLFSARTAGRSPMSEALPCCTSELSGVLGRWKFYAQVVEEQGPDPSLLGLPVSGPRGAALRGLGVLDPGELRACGGELRARLCGRRSPLQVQPFSGTSSGLDAATLKRAVRANGIAMETYLPGVGAVITGTARSALERHGGAA